MNPKYNALFSSIKFNCGAEIDSRFAMAPMVVCGSSYEGIVQDDDLKYFERRSSTAPLLITGAANVGPYGNAFAYGLSLESDNHLEPMAKLAQTMKAKGAKAIIQLFHPGRQAKYSFQDQGIAYGPSSMEVDFLDYPVTGMSVSDVEDMIDYFKLAAERAIKAGFDGIEIHGANHYLIQQFFSANSNHRQDQWGGSLENRSNFPLAVVKAIKSVIDHQAKDDFILGYRLSPEEIHGQDVGYTLTESLYLVDQIVDLGLDYIHTSQWGPMGFANKSLSGDHQGQIINQEIRHCLKDRALLIGAGDITDPDKALQALDYVDIVALGSAAIIEPDFVEKIRTDKTDKINLQELHNYADLQLPSKFYRMVNSLTRNGSVSQEVVDYIGNQTENDV